MLYFQGLGIMIIFAVSPPQIPLEKPRHRVLSGEDLYDYTGHFSKAWHTLLFLARNAPVKLEVMILDYK